MLSQYDSKHHVLKQKLDIVFPSKDVEVVSNIIESHGYDNLKKKAIKDKFRLQV